MLHKKEILQEKENPITMRAGGSISHHLDTAHGEDCYDLISC